MAAVAPDTAAAEAPPLAGRRALFVSWVRHHGRSEDLAAALGRITAKTFVMPIDEDQLFPVRDCKPEQELIKGSELRVVNDISGHLGLFGAVPTFMPQIDRHLGDLLNAEV